MRQQSSEEVSGQVRFSEGQALPNERFVVKVQGAARLELDVDGSFLLGTAAGPIRQTPPTAWEVLPNGEERTVPSRFRLLDGERYTFEVPGCQKEYALAIDAGLVWGTDLGGSGHDTPYDLAAIPDRSGDILIARPPTASKPETNQHAHL